jgi:hypothetical protein
MALGATLIISGLAFVIGAIWGEASGPPDGDIAWLYVVGGAQLLAPFVLFGTLLLAPVRTLPFAGMAPRWSKWLSEPPTPTDGIRPRRVWLVVIPAAYGGALAGSILARMPAKLPGIALGLPFLLDLERAAAIVAAVAAVLIFAALTARGKLPTTVGSVGYPETVRAEENRLATELLAQNLPPRVVTLERAEEENAKALKLVQQELQALRSRLDAIPDL